MVGKLKVSLAEAIVQRNNNALRKKTGYRKKIRSGEGKQKVRS